MARILSIDYGKKRTGLAVTDPLQLIAGGLATVSTSELFEYLKAYVEREQVERIVIGEPRQPNGQPSENLPRVQQFVNRWRKAMPQIPIELYDERFTSVLAHQAMIDGGLRKKARQDKALVDEISATIILQDYMRSRKLYTLHSKLLKSDITYLYLWATRIAKGCRGYSHGLSQFEGAAG